MNTSPTIMCNKALRFIGADRIGNFTDAGDPAATCRLYWDTVWPTVCRARPWKCISKQATLTQAGPTPVHSYLYSFVLPADYLRMVGMDHPRRRYQTFGKHLYCDTSPAYIDYVYRCTDWSLYNEDLERCLYLNLAYELAYALTQNVEIGDRVKTDLEKFFLPLVSFTDSVESGAEEFESDILTDQFTTRRNRNWSFDHAEYPT